MSGPREGQIKDHAPRKFKGTTPTIAWPLEGGCAELSPGGRGVETHEIRLRGGWECGGADGLGPKTRVSLPIELGTLPMGRLRLIRRFQRPPRVADEPVELRLRQVAGLESVQFNGRPIGPISPERAAYALELGPLDARNELVMVMERPGADGDWGLISLVFRTRE